MTKRYFLFFFAGAVMNVVYVLTTLSIALTDRGYRDELNLLWSNRMKAKLHSLKHKLVSAPQRPAYYSSYIYTQASLFLTAAVYSLTNRPEGVYACFCLAMALLCIRQKDATSTKPVRRSAHRASIQFCEWLAAVLIVLALLSLFDFRTFKNVDGSRHLPAMLSTSPTVR